MGSRIIDEAEHKDHLGYMTERFGRPDPPCIWCKAPVVRQWSDLDGLWTTDLRASGRPLELDWQAPGAVCAAAPNGEHDVGPLD